jgi:alpha-L-rhamnosidase
LTSASAAVLSMYGRVASGWKIADGKMTLSIEVPTNTTATVRLPNAKLEETTEGQKALSGRSDLRDARQARDAVLVEVGSGSYVFESPL